MGSWLGSIHWAPSGKTVRRISPPHDDEHCAAAISEGTGYCWTGYSDGRIELFDPSAYSFEVITQRPSPNNVHSARGILPDFQVVLTASETRGWVTSLVTAGPVEVVATFSKGVMLLLRATSPRTIEIVREFVGFVNEGGYTRNCIHADSRLVAVAAWGQPVRIWHLDDTYPLNSAWHRQRRGLKALDLLPKPRSKDKQPDRATSTTNDAQSTLAPIDAATTAPSSGSDGPDAALVSTIAPSNASTPYSATAAWDDPPPDDAASIASSTSKKETKSASTGQTAARGKGRPKPCGTLLELLARRSITDKKAKKAAQERFGDLIPEQSCGMTFAPTSWVADRDAQWEMTRDFEGDDGDGGLRPKAISAGLLPSIVCGTSSLRGPMLIYFEPERKAGVEIKDDGEVGSAQNEEVKKEKKSVEGAKGGEQEGGGSSTSLLAQS